MIEWGEEILFDHLMSESIFQVMNNKKIFIDSFVQRILLF